MRLSRKLASIIQSTDKYTYGSNSTLASALIAPTRIYVKPVLNVIRDFTVNGIVHITGGGFVGNVPRILPKGVRAHSDPAAWPRPPVFDWIRDEANLPESEMIENGNVVCEIRSERNTKRRYAIFVGAWTVPRNASLP